MIFALFSFSICFIFYFYLSWCGQGVRQLCIAGKKIIAQEVSGGQIIQKDNSAHHHGTCGQLTNSARVARWPNNSRVVVK